ncbi:MAG: CAP domain-containing protein, partial [Albidovulum sp.]
MAHSETEQLMLELINRARLDPQGEAARAGIGLNDGLAPDTISGTPKSVLAPNDMLAESSEDHSAWMLSNDTFSHTGAGGSNPSDRMESAGYSFGPGSSSGENISYQSSTAPLDLNAVIRAQHEGLIQSSGHRTAIMNEGFSEVGIGNAVGPFQNFQHSSMITENFARGDDSVFVTGVVYDDTDQDGFYSLGEGSAGTTVAVGGQQASSEQAGGYALKLGAGAGATEVALTSGARSGTVEVDLSGGNVKLDVVNGTEVQSSSDLKLVSGFDDARLLGVADLELTGNDAANKLSGNGGANVIAGGAGDDVIDGGGGADEAVFDVASTDIQVTRAQNGYVVTSSEGSDT